MKISDNICIGVEMEIYCNFYNHIYNYINFLNNEFDNKFTDEYTLIGFIICNDDNFIYEKYYIEFENTIYKYSHKVKAIKNNKSKIKWNDVEIINKEDFIKEVKKQKHVLDMEYFYRNN